MNKLVNSISFAVKAAFFVCVVGSALAFFGAPTFFGMVIITGSVIATVVTYTAISFAIAFAFKLLKKDANEPPKDNTD